MEHLEGSINRKLTTLERRSTLKIGTASELKQNSIEAETQKNNFFDASSLD